MPLSTAFRQGSDIPKKYTCDGDNVSPPLAWSGAPESTRSFLLVCDDPDAPAEIFHHWAAFDIPPDWRGLKEGHGAESLGRTAFAKPSTISASPATQAPVHRAATSHTAIIFS